MIEQLVAILLLCGLLGVIGCMVVKIAQAKCWTWTNRNTLLARAAERWRAIGP
jgi:hypothetical protein